MDGLIAAPERFEFQQAVRLLERIYPKRHEVGGDVESSSEVVRFRSSIAFSRPPTEGISRVEPPAGPGQPATMTVDFMGLATPASFGSLPDCYAEMVTDQNRVEDFALRDFLDIFNHRLVSQFYRAWKKHNLPSQYRPGALNSCERAVLSFIGLATPGLMGRFSFHDKALIYRAGLFGGRRRSAAALRSLLRSYFRTDARIEQFMPAWERIDPVDRACLQRRNTRLGRDIFLGSRIRLSQFRFRAHLGPMGWDLYRDLLPTGPGYRAALELIRFTVGPEFGFDLRLALRREDVPALKLGDDGAGKARLGWSTWLKSRQMTRDPSDAVIRTERDTAPPAAPAAVGAGTSEVRESESEP